jgi:amidase
MEAWMLKRACIVLLFAPTLLFAQNNIAGTWLATTDIFGNPLNQRLTLQASANSLSGKLGDGKLEGSLAGNAVHFVIKGSFGQTFEYDGTIAGDSMSGTVLMIDDDTKERTNSTFTAKRVPERPAGPPRRHEFVPTTFQRRFSPEIKPALTIWPGDTVHTTTVDAGGTDEKSVTRVLGGNPETGPFYVETALPGDVLAIHIVKLKLNRDWATSDDAIVDRAVDNDMALKLKDTGKPVRWHLDREKMIARQDKPTEHLKDYVVPLHPMLGCVAVAPGFASAPPPTGDSGGYGGNMDFNGIVEGSTVYLQVRQPGALLYVGDGHAVQGDGELNGNALETSMEVEFSVDVIPQKQIDTPRVESPAQIMVVGLGGSLEAALKEATSGMAQWLEQDYKLTPSEIAQVLGTSSEIVINEVADRNAGIVIRLRKDRLQPIPLAPAEKK